MKLSEQIKRCLDGGGCKECENYESGSRLTCPGLMQKAYEIVKKHEEMFPCEVGDEVYAISRARIEPMEISEFSIFKIDGNEIVQIVCVDAGSYGIYHYLVEEIGETVFLTREQAEAELSRIKGKEE